MVRYETFKQYSDRTGLSLSSVYRAARKGKLKITDIKGVNHIIIEKESSLGNDDHILDDNIDKHENDDFMNIDKRGKAYQEAEIVDDITNSRYEIDVFKSSLMTISEMANRVEAAKDETILNLKEILGKQQQNIDNLNDIIKTLSSDNQELRIQLAIRETELNISDKKAKEYDNIIIDKDKQLNELLEKNLIKEEQLIKNQEKQSVWSKFFKIN